VIKIVYCMHRRPELSHSDFLVHWRQIHAPIVLANKSVLRLARYVQTSPLDHAISARVTRPGAMQAPFDGVAELVWTCQEDFLAAFESPAALAVQRELALDERLFVDTARSPRWICEEARLV